MERMAPDVDMCSVNKHTPEMVQIADAGGVGQAVGITSLVAIVYTLLPRFWWIKRKIKQQKSTTQSTATSSSNV
jgi:hypothetical protein